MNLVDPFSTLLSGLNRRALAFCLAGGMAWAGASHAQSPYLLPPPKAPSSKSRFAFNYRLGLNIGVTFEDAGRFRTVGLSKLTPNGDPYNYDDGYVLPDISGSGADTWYWGYENPGASADVVSLTRSSVEPNDTTYRDLQESPELSYWYSVGRAGAGHWGWMGAFNFTHIQRHIRGPSSLEGQKRMDDYLAPAPPPPEAPYFGTFEGPVPGGPYRPLLSLTPTTSQFTSTIAAFDGFHSYEANLFGLKLGPYLVVPLAKRLSLDLSGGLVLGLVKSRYKFDETVTVPSIGSMTSSGSSSQTEFLVGAFASMQLWQMLSRDLGIFLGAEYQYLGTSIHQTGGKSVTLDLRSPVFLSLGFGYAF